MMNTTQYAQRVMEELDRTLMTVVPQDAERVIDLILGVKRVFIAGAGRSGLAARAFAMRLMHMGVETYVVGETVTPAMEADDLLLIGSGSGETGSLVSMAEKAKQLGASIALVTIFPESRIGLLASAVVRIPASTPKGSGGDSGTSVQPMGSLFEQTLLLLFDIMVLQLMDRRGINSAAMFARHANLE